MLSEDSTPDLLNRGGHSPAYFNRNPEGVTERPRDQRHIPEEETTPADFLHSQLIYRDMFKDAKRMPVPDGADMIVYEGHLTKLFERNGFSTPYYSKITRKLKAMGCIRQLRRGGGGTESQWELRTEPTMELYHNMPSRLRATQSTASDLSAQNAQQIRNLTGRVAKLEETVEQLVLSLASNSNE